VLSAKIFPNSRHQKILLAKLYHHAKFWVNRSTIKGFMIKFQFFLTGSKILRRVWSWRGERWTHRQKWCLWLVLLLWSIWDLTFFGLFDFKKITVKCYNISFTLQDRKKIIVEFTNFVSRVWAQIVERVVVRFDWDFNTIILHLYLFIFATWKKKFPITGDFPRAEKRENEAVFLTLQKTVDLYEIFYVMKVMGKFLWGVFLIGRIHGAKIG
jgi:hypothetical protein